MPIAVPFASILRLGRRLMASHSVRILIICAGFGMVLMAGLHSGRDFANALYAAILQGKGQPGITSARHPRAAQPAETIKPADEFFTRRVGQLLFTNHNSDFCLRMLFNNRSGELLEDGYAACGLITEAGDPSVDRAERLRRAFRK